MAKFLDAEIRLDRVKGCRQISSSQQAWLTKPVPKRDTFSVGATRRVSTHHGTLFAAAPSAIAHERKARSVAWHLGCRVRKHLSSDTAPPTDLSKSGFHPPIALDPCLQKRIVQ